MANKKKKKAARERRTDEEAQKVQQAAPGGGTWHLLGRDALDWGFYPLPGVYASRKEAERAARARLRYLEGFQPTKTSGGQAGIQDRVYVVGPDGTSYRLMK